MSDDRALATLLAEAATGVALDEAAMASWGRTLGRLLPSGAVIALHGELGAGKTTLVRALAEGLDVLDLAAVTSPTYAIVHEYATPHGPVLHADLYRLRRREELEPLGWEEAVAGARATLVEWPERAPAALPADAWHVILAHVPGRPSVRSLRVTAPGRV